MRVPDNASRQHPFIGEFYLNIKVVFLLKILLIWPNQWIKGVIAAYRTYYLKKTIVLANAATEKDVEKILMQFWKDYNFHDSIKNIAWSWIFVTKDIHSSRYSIWKQTLKRFVQDLLKDMQGRSCCKNQQGHDWDNKEL